MAITAKPTAGSYSLNAGATHAPTHLWMMDENTGTTLADKGTGSHLTLALGATTGAGPDWISDGTHGTVLDWIQANEDYAEVAVSGLSGTHTLGVLCQISAGTGNRFIFQFEDPAVSSKKALVRFNGDETISASSQFADTATTNLYATSNPSLGTWIWVMCRFSDTDLSVSFDGAAWETDVVSHVGLVAGLTTFTVGADRDSGPSGWMDDPIGAVAWWTSSKSDAEIASIYNSGNIWAGMGIGSGTTISPNIAGLSV
jgi:hypothetical protein